MNGAPGRFTFGGSFAEEQSLSTATSSLGLACQEIATHLGISPQELHFVGNGPLAHTLALAGLPPQPRLVSAVERAELLAQASKTLPVSPSGHLLESAIKADTYSLGWVNGEIGSVQEIDSWAVRIHQSGGLLHSDLSYGLGVLPVPTGWDLASIDARAFGGPTLGILAIKSRTRWSDPLPTLSPRYGQLHVDERLIVEAAAALGTFESLAKTHFERISTFNRDLRAKCGEVAHIDVAGDPAGIPHIITFSVLYAQGEELVRAFAREGFVVASGSACMSTNLEPSHVLVATGRLTHGNIRLVVPYDEPADSLARFLEVLPRIVEGVRQA